MKRAKKFIISPNWQVLFNDMNLDINAVARIAQLPADMFTRENLAFTSGEYFRFWSAIEQAEPSKNVPLLLAEHMSVEAFDAPIFASLCSENLNEALKRLKQYKPLIGPIELEIDITEHNTQLLISCYGNSTHIPCSLGLCEAVFFTQLARLATREEIKPIKVILTELPPSVAQYESYFGCALEQGETIRIVFSSQDAQLPFLTANAQMWDFFEAKLNTKLNDLDNDATMAERVRAVLVELIPSGHYSIEKVASALAVSKRTLQRKLTAEAETFQSVLQGVRQNLAEHYLMQSHLSLGEISFLLGFEEPNSFIRAYSHWTGISPGQYREQH